MISLDISILYQVVLFIVLWLILSKVLFQPYLRLLEEREQRTSGAQHDSSYLEREGARLRAEYEEKIQSAQAAAYADRERLLQSVRDEREKILGEARENATQTLEKAREEIASALAAERALADNEAAQIAAVMASKVLGRTVS